MGDGFTWDTKNPEQDRATARETWNVCVEKLRSGDYDLLVFDELVYVLSYELLPVADVLEEFRSIRASQPALHIVVTGRDAPAALIELKGESSREKDQLDVAVLRRILAGAEAPVAPDLTTLTPPSDLPPAASA